jgi:3-oxoacyl-[acyl-carrier-protein] synthase III
MFSRILSTGAALPTNIVSNADLERELETTDDWITTRTGIRQRHIAGPNVDTSDLAVEAARIALARGAVRAESLDVIVVGTITSDMVFPSTAALIQGRLNARTVGAFDVSAACSGFVYALAVADAMIKSSAARRALVIGAEKMSKIVDPADRATRVLFGDGAAAVVLEAADAPGILSTHLHADGSTPEELNCAPGAGHSFIRMQGGHVFRFAVRAMVDAAREVLVKNRVDIDEIDWFVPHQANRRIIETAAKHLGISWDRVVLTVGEHANTSAASVPLALDRAVSDGRIQRGDKVLLVAVGGGFTWASSLVVW